MRTRKLLSGLGAAVMSLMMIIPWAVYADSPQTEDSSIVTESSAAEAMAEQEVIKAQKNSTQNTETDWVLFGFPLAAVRNGIRLVWASEIETFPIEVTKLRFPNMIHVGDITKLNGAELPPVNIICGGSPCQDLSVAGARAGLAGARSGLFMEQVRLTKEMRNADELRGRTAIDRLR